MTLFLIGDPHNKNVHFQKISIPTPRKVIGSSEGEGGFKSQNFLKNHEAKLEFPEGWEGFNQKTFRGWGMDTFWNNMMLPVSHPIKFAPIDFSPLNSL